MSGRLDSFIKTNAFSPSPLWRVQRVFDSPLGFRLTPASISGTVKRIMASTAADAKTREYYFFGVFGVFRPMAGRWGDGTFPVWYGADTGITAMHEVLYHAANRRIYDMGGVAALDGWKESRALLSVSCSALLIDVVGLASRHSWLTDDDYRQCQSLGRYIHDQDLHGVLYKSARSAGKCAAVYHRNVLGTALIHSDIYLGYNGSELEISDSAGNQLISRPL